MKIGTLNGYQFSVSAINDIKTYLKIRGRIEVVTFDSLLELVSSLKQNKIGYILLPSRLSYTNDVSPVCLDLILRSYGEGINEIFSNLDKSKVYKATNFKTNQDSAVCFGNKYFVPSSNVEKIPEQKRNYLEYKVFKKSDVKASKFSKLCISLFGNRKANFVFNLLSAFISLGAIAYLVFSIINFKSLTEYFLQILAVVILIIQAFIKVFDIEKKVEKSLVKGYWIYYSFEDTYELGNYVPKGFTTRLLKIDEENGQLSMKCGFAGSDTLFWEASNFNYDYNPVTKIAQGFYSYSANILNAKGKRPEGTCMFKGKVENSNPINYMDGWFSGRGTMINGRVKYIRITKEDYELLSKSFPDRSTTFEKSVVVVGIFGDAGSNTDYSFDQYYSHSINLFKKNRVIKKYYSSFEDMYCELENGKLNYVIVPLKNKNVSIKAQIIGKLQSLESVFKRDFQLVDGTTKEVEIDYVLCSNNRKYDISKKTIFNTNIEARKQCSDFIGGNKCNTNYSSTSEAARCMSLGELDGENVVICNERAANIYALNILHENGKIIKPVNKGEPNITKFAMFKTKEK